MGKEVFVYPIIIVSVVIFALLATIFVFLNVYQNKYLRQEQQKQKELEEIKNGHLNELFLENEKQKHQIARDLHDEIGPLVSVLKLELRGIEESEKDAVFNVLNTISTKIKEACNILRPRVLELHGLRKSLEMMMFNYVDHYNIEFRSDDDFNFHLDKAQTVHLYRIVTELMNNIHKHSHAKHISLDLATPDHKRQVKIVHDGKGLTNESFHEAIRTSSGHGLSNIYSRVILLNGTISFTHSAKSKNEIILELPIRIAEV